MYRSYRVFDDLDIIHLYQGNDESYKEESDGFSWDNDDPLSEGFWDRLQGYVNRHKDDPEVQRKYNEFLNYPIFIPPDDFLI